MSVTFGLVMFDDAEELDFVGPWEVFTMGAQSNGSDRVVTIAEHARRRGRQLRDQTLHLER